MSAETVKAPIPRWLPLLGGLLGSTCCGLLLYAFSVFIRPLRLEFGWTTTEVALAYAIGCLVFGLMTFPAGKLSDRFGPRPVVFVGSIILCIGFMMVSTITTKYHLYVYYGLIACFGGGMIYLPPIATAPKWWPDRRALATGFAVVGLGLGSFIMGPLATGLIQTVGVFNVFLYVGMAMGVMGIIASLCVQNPPAGWKPEGWNPPAPAPGAAVKVSRDYTHEETIRTPQFWYLYLAYFFGSFAGLMVTGHIAFHGILGMEKVFAAAQGIAAADVRALFPVESAQIALQASYAVSGLAAFNALTRVLSGALVDKIGIRTYFIVLTLLQACAMLVLFSAGSSWVTLVAVAMVIGWNFGAQFVLYPATCLSFYGPTFQGANYGLLFTAWGLAGFAGPLTGGYLQTTFGTYMVPFTLAAALCVVAAVFLYMAKPPEKKSA